MSISIESNDEIENLRNRLRRLSDAELIRFGKAARSLCRNWDCPRRFRWHVLEHTFASRLVMSGVPLRVVQIVMGHKRIETTLRYSHLGDTHLHRVVQRLTETPPGTTTGTGQTGMAASRGIGTSTLECLVPKRGLEPPRP